MNQPKTQPTKPSQVSAGALRAADKIENSEPPNCEHIDPKFESFCSACFIQWEARIIDRETGVAELLGAAKDSMQLLSDLGEAVVPHYPYIAQEASVSVSRLKQAIAKCEGGE